MMDAAFAVHELVLAIDERGSQWFTSPKDRREQRGRLDLARTMSPGGIASQILARFRVEPPMETFALSPGEHRAWAETFHGGWCEVDDRILGWDLSVGIDDVRACYPLVAHLIRWWDLLCPERVIRRRVTAKLRRLLRKAAEDPTIILDPEIWQEFGCCLVTLLPQGNVLPVEVVDDLRPDGRLEFRPVLSPHGRVIRCTALDVIASAVKTGKVPEILAAVAYVPSSDRQPGLRRRLPLLPGVVAHVGDDPVLPLVRHRQRVKEQGEETLAADLRVILNSLVFGILSRFDPVWKKERGEWIRVERAGPWNCLPIAVLSHGRRRSPPLPL